MKSFVKMSLLMLATVPFVEGTVSAQVCVELRVVGPPVPIQSPQLVFPGWWVCAPPPITVIEIVQPSSDRLVYDPPTGGWIADPPFQCAPEGITQILNDSPGVNPQSFSWRWFMKTECLPSTVIEIEGSWYRYQQNVNTWYELRGDTSVALDQGPTWVVPAHSYCLRLKTGEKQWKGPFGFPMRSVETDGKSIKSFYGFVLWKGKVHRGWCPILKHDDVFIPPVWEPVPQHNEPTPVLPKAHEHFEYAPELPSPSEVQAPALIVPPSLPAFPREETTDPFDNGYEREESEESGVKLKLSPRREQNRPRRSPELQDGPVTRV